MNDPTSPKYLNILFSKSTEKKPHFPSERAKHALKSFSINYTEIDVSDPSSQTRFFGSKDVEFPALYLAECVGGIDVIRNTSELMKKVATTEPPRLPARTTSSYLISKEAPARLTLKGEEETSHFKTHSYSFPLQTTQSKAQMVLTTGETVKGKLFLWAKYFYFEPEMFFEIKKGKYKQLVALNAANISEPHLVGGNQDIRKNIFLTGEDEVLQFKYKQQKSNKSFKSKTRTKTYTFILSKKKAPDILSQLSQGISLIKTNEIESEMNVDRTVYSNSIELEDVLNLYNPSSIIKPPKLLKKLYKFIPPIYRIQNCKLLFSTSLHGVSLNSFYSRSEDVHPTLLVVKDTSDHIFGAFVTGDWRNNSSFYGTGESFLWTLSPEVHVYKWTSSNDYFQFSDSTQIALGSGSKKRHEHYLTEKTPENDDNHFTKDHGLWIGSDFSVGTSQVCDTYFNRCLASSPEFRISCVELWGFTTELEKSVEVENSLDEKPERDQSALVIVNM